MSKYTEVILPHIRWIDNDQEDPQMIMQRQPNTASLHIDSRLGYQDTDISNNIIVASNINQPQFPPIELIKNSRRGAIKHFQLFYYLDTIIAGYNDTFVMALQINPPDPPRYTVITVTIPPGVYGSVSDIGTALQTALNNWFIANWGAPPIPVATVTFNAPTISTLLGSLTITVNTMLITVPLLGIDPNCSFIANSEGMLILSANNSYPTPIDTDPRINFFSLVPFSYIDIISDALTRNSKLLSTTNTLSNYRVLHRIYDPQYGFNFYDYTEPLNWFNLNKDDILYQIDFRFIDQNGIPIPGAVTRNFWWLMQISLEK